MKKKKYYTLTDYSKHLNEEVNNETLYEYMIYLYKNVYIIKKLTKTITYVEKIYTPLDILNEAYLKALNTLEKNNEYTSRNFENYLWNKLRYVNRLKRKTLGNISFEESKLESTLCNTEGVICNKVYIKELLDGLLPEDRLYIELYFFEKLTYQQIADMEEIPLFSKRGVKNKIDSILQGIKKKYINK